MILFLSGLLFGLCFSVGHDKVRRKRWTKKHQDVLKLVRGD